MKSVIVAILAALGMGVTTPFTQADEPKREPHPRFKGVELYSWKDDKKGWQFALVSGTNEEKSANEIKNAATVYSGTEKLSSALNQLAQGESVYWTHIVPGFAFPPKEDQETIEKVAKAAMITLRRPER